MKDSAKKTRDTRAALIEAGIRIMFEKGYNNTGIQEVLLMGRAPKGSFYHYFPSKEQFALEVIEVFDRRYCAFLCNIMNKPGCSALERLHGYCVLERRRLSAHQCRGGCLIGNLSLEMADQHDGLRQALLKVFTGWRGIFADCVRAGQNAGQLNNAISAEKLAELFLTGWSAAVASAKLQKSIEPLDAFIESFFPYILIGPASFAPQESRPVSAAQQKEMQSPIDFHVTDRESGSLARETQAIS